MTAFTFLVMPGTGVSPHERPRFRLQRRIVEVEGLASPAVREGQQRKWHPDFTPRDLVELPLLYDCHASEQDRVALRGQASGGPRFHDLGPAAVACPGPFQSPGVGRRPRGCDLSFRLGTLPGCPWREAKGVQEPPPPDLARRGVGLKE